MTDSEREFEWYDRGTWAAPGPYEPASLNEDSSQEEDAPAAAPGEQGGPDTVSGRACAPSGSGASGSSQGGPPAGGSEAAGVSDIGKGSGATGGSGNSRGGPPAGVTGGSDADGGSDAKEGPEAREGSENGSGAAPRRARVRVGLLSALIAFLLYLAAFSPSGDRSPAGGSDADGVPRSRPPVGRQRSMWERLHHAGLAVLLFAVILTLIGGLDGSSRAAEALSPQGTESISALGSPPNGAVGALSPIASDSFSGSGGSADWLLLLEDAGVSAAGVAAGSVYGSSGSPASSRSSCPAGYYFYFSIGGLLCAKRISQTAGWGCPTGSSQFSLGVAPAWGCRKDLGTASTSYSCASGALVWRTVGSGFARMCKITTSGKETRNASASCTPRGTPTSCSYPAQVTFLRTQSASVSCNPRGTPNSCSYTEQVTTLRTQSASVSCNPRGTPNSCSYTAQVSSRQTQSASRYCTPRGTPASCRYLLRQSRSASFQYVPPVGGYYYCSPGWTLSSSTCYRYVTQYGSLRYSCPTGWTRSGATCYRYVTSNVTRYGTLTYTCPPGWTRSGAACSRNVTSNVTRYGTLTYTCPPGWTRSGAACSRNVTSTVTRYGTLSYSCPPGWSRSGSTCTRTTTSTSYVSPSSSQSCSTGTLSGGRCWSYPAKIRTCSTGWVLSSSTCTRTLYTSPTYTYSCSQGKTLRGTRCHTPTTTTTTTTTAPVSPAPAPAAPPPPPPPATPPPPPPPPAVTTTTVAAASTTTVAGAPQVVATTTTTTTLPCAQGTVRTVASGCVSPPALPTNYLFLRGNEQIRVFWQNSPSTSVTITNYKVRWREAESTAAVFNTAATVSPAKVGPPPSNIVQDPQFFERTITGLTNGTEYEVKIEVNTNAVDAATGDTLSASAEGSSIPRPPEGDGGWQPYELPREKTAALNEKIRRGEPLRVCTSAPDFETTLTSAVNAWNNALNTNPTRSDFQNVFTFNGVSNPSECGEQAYNPNPDSESAQIISNTNYDIIVSDYRCTPTTTTTTAATTTVPHCGAPAVQLPQGCQPGAGHPTSTIECSPRRCTDPRANTLYCANTSTLCPAEAAACVLSITQTPADYDPGTQIGSAIQIVHDRVGSDVALFAHELGHLLGLADYGYTCAWETTSVSPYSQTTQSKHPSLFSYSNGPRSWQAVITDPNLYSTGYFNCRSSTITTRDEKDFRAIYRPKRFTNNRFIRDEDSSNGDEVWRLDFGHPPRDKNPTATRKSKNVYNAYRWIVMHRAPKKTTPPRQPNEDCTYEGDYTILTADTSFDMPTPTTSDDELIALTAENLISKMPVTSLGSRQHGRFRLNTNFNTDEFREHQFIVVGITRGDHLADASLTVGMESSVVSIDLDGDGVLEKWTLGEPSLPFRMRPCNSTTSPTYLPSATTTTTTTP